jgi:ATP-dependent Zn protease
MSPPTDEATAYHEAGHAVASLALGRPVHRVSVLPDCQFLGRCEFGKAAFRPSEDWLEREALIALGGLAAEALHTDNYAWDESARDLRYVRDLAVQRAGQRQADRLVRRLLAKAEHLLARDDHWRAVELIAAELIRRGTVSGRAARHLFDRACAAR